MKKGANNFAIIAVVIAILPTGMTAESLPRTTADWQLRRISTSSVCLVQLSTASPIGQLVSTHPSKGAACEAANNEYDSSMSDPTKCWEYGPATKAGCKAEGISLPGA